MKITSAEFIKGAVKKADFPNDLPEIAIAGRSNVGKSSLINFLLERKKLVSISKKPGKTTEINYFLINKSFYIVDLPGFGYAKLSHSERDELTKRVESYFNYSEKIQGLIYLLDLRIKRSSVDEQSLEWINGFEIPLLMVGTKADKLKKLELSASLVHLKKQYDLPLSPLVTSSSKKIGRDEVWEQIAGLLES